MGQKKMRLFLHSTEAWASGKKVCGGGGGIQAHFLDPPSEVAPVTSH